jgi:hypothetical protein
LKRKQSRSKQSKQQSGNAGASVKGRDGQKTFVV